MKKDLRDIKKEFGYILRWTHHVIEQGEQPKVDCVYLDNDEEKIYIVDYDENILNQEAYDFICKKTYNEFRVKSSIDCYDNYVKLFEIMSIEKKERNEMEIDFNEYRDLVIEHFEKNKSLEDKFLKERKKRLNQYSKILKRAFEMGIIKKDLDNISVLMDLESADLTFDLDFEKWLKADEFNFSHDFVGILNHIERGNFPSSNFNFFVPRFARTTKG